MRKLTLNLALVFIGITGCSQNQRVNKRTIASQVESDKAILSNLKTLESKILVGGSDGFSLTSSLPAAALVAAKGSVVGCVDEVRNLEVSDLSLSIQVPFDCTNSEISLTEISLGFAGFGGVVNLEQGIATFLNNDLGSVKLNGFAVDRVGIQTNKSIDISIGNKTVQTSITIDGSELACQDLLVSQNGSNIDLIMVGTFPLVVLNSQSENLSYKGTSTAELINHAHFQAHLPAVQGEIQYDARIDWNDSDVAKYCSFNVTVNFDTQDTELIAADSIQGCPFGVDQLWDQDHPEYCTYDRLAAVLIPAVCTEGKKLLVSTVMGSENKPVIFNAICK